MNTNPGYLRRSKENCARARPLRRLAASLIFSLLLCGFGPASAQNPAWELSGPQLLIPDQSELIVPEQGDPAPLGPDSLVLPEQNPVATPHGKSIVVESPVVAPQSSADEVPVASGANCQATDYWVISTRKCPAQVAPENADNCVEFLHQDDGSTLRKASAAEFFGSLQPGVPVCFFIHGSLITYEAALRDGAGTYRWLRAAAPQSPFHLVVLTWPADQDLTYIFSIDALNLGIRAGQHGGHLGRLISQIPPSHPISVIGHSHGGRLAASALHLLGGGEVQGYRLPANPGNEQRIRTVLAAAAIDHHWLNPGERYEMALPRTESLLNITNARDIVLAIYPLRAPFAGSALGRSGFTQYDRWQLSSLNAKVRDFEVVQLLGHKHLWPAYYEQPSIASTIAPYVFFSDDPRSPGASGSATSTESLGPASRIPQVRASTHQLRADPVRGLNLNDNLLPRR